MEFCKHCGRSLDEGELCTCRGAEREREREKERAAAKKAAEERQQAAADISRASDSDGGMYYGGYFDGMARPEQRPEEPDGRGRGPEPEFSQAGDGTGNANETVQPEGRSVYALGIVGFILSAVSALPFIGIILGHLAGSRAKAYVEKYNELPTSVRRGAVLGRFAVILGIVMTVYMIWTLYNIITMINSGEFVAEMEKLREVFGWL